MSAPFTPGDASTWGNTGERADIRALRRYSAWLDRALSVGEAVSIVLAIAIALAMAATLRYLNFENVIFTDGTSHVCVLNGSTGAISHGE